MGILSIFSVILLLAVKFITTSSIMITVSVERDSESTVSSEDSTSVNDSWCSRFTNFLYNAFDDYDDFSSEQINMRMIYIENFRNDSLCEVSVDSSDAEGCDVEAQVAEATEVSFFDQVAELDEDETDMSSITTHANRVDVPVAIPMNEGSLSNTIVAYINGRPVYTQAEVEEAFSNLSTSRSTDISTRSDFSPLRFRAIFD